MIGGRDLAFIDPNDNNSRIQIRNGKDTDINKNILSSKHVDNDFIDNESFSNMLGKFDGGYYLDKKMSSDINKQMANLSLLNNNNNYLNTSNSNMKLRPVITKKNNRVNALNTNKRVIPAQPQIRVSSPSSEKTPNNVRNTSIRLVVRKTMTGSQSKLNSSTNRSSAGSYGSPKIARPITTPPENSTACSICGRYFHNDRIEKHEVICEKAAAKKRKIFDATKQRVQGTEVEPYVKKNSRIGAKKAAPAAGKKSNWRRMHEEFIQTIRSAKQVQQHLANGGKLTDLPPPPPSENPDYVQCPHCSRRFNETAAARHIPKCANFQFNKPKPKPVAAAKANLAKRRF